ncbi:hypothetical protein GCM10010912_53230 [Paenibacillus albidus]|uniref:Winged helix DNA-binding domain-containing protein n=1 Tax=Paenibacillus albidus TaxID=2041023 RepID=A0A917FSJ0_9BACL|nr:winged helix DNA-binding domain-containing protein [Paenibacillus albidus]GGG01740.1 hypothetical protein GCM10010912_53230 [Paenibacillus albidus]
MTTNRIIGERRLNNQYIEGTLPGKPHEVVEAMGALQAQDYMQAVWAIGSRMSSAGLADIEAAITARTLVLTWVQRGTIHFVPAGDVKWMLQLVAPRLLAQAKPRLAQLELDDKTLEHCRKIIYNALKERGLVERGVLFQLLEEAGIATAHQRGYHILWHSASQGLICFGPKQGKQQTFVLLDEWVPHTRELSFEESCAELARRYFISHGPATVQDFAWWTGMTVADARRGLDSIKSELGCETIDGTEYWMSLSPIKQTAAFETSGVHLLAGFDEFILGYKDRSAVLEPEAARLIVPGNNGVFLPTIVTDGQVTGTWKRTLKPKGIEIIINPFTPLGEKEVQVRQAADRYAAFIGLPILKYIVSPC